MKQTLAEQFRQLKMMVGGSREKTHYEDTFGMPKEEQAHIARPSRSNTRILAELAFALQLSQTESGKYDAELETAIASLRGCLMAHGTLTDEDCSKAEELLAPIEAAAKSYTMILAAHAHIDMNWMWSYTETVAVVLATFRSILNIMRQYPDFRFSQSQAAAYHIVEEYDPALMEEIKQRIREGRWEVTASSWVECDKNMPSTESLLRHILYTRHYLSEKWGVSDFSLDFSPDTFGHSANMPEIDTFGDIRYFYHCRGLQEERVLYRFRAPSGREVLAYKEPYWYNGAVTAEMAAGLPVLSRKCGGLKTGLYVYGVGDHGGGPTRRDVERILEMQKWKIYPQVRFGTFGEFFRAAESVRDALPVVSHELNYFAPGCYTTQSRIKRGNRRTEAALLDAGMLSAQAAGFAGFHTETAALETAWQKVLFTHFHDILTGSCVQDTREHAMGLYQTAMAVANTQSQNAMRTISEQVNTSGIPVDIDAYNSQSEGAGAGYGVDHFVGVPSTERGSGLTRIFQIFNTLPQERTGTVELTVWDYTGDLKNLSVADSSGQALPFQTLDKELQTYWDHKYFRILVRLSVPAAGYTTIVLNQAKLAEYPVYFQSGERTTAAYDNYVLKNSVITATVSAVTGQLLSVRRNEDGRELINTQAPAGLELLDTEAATSNAWQIGRTLKTHAVDKCLRIEKLAEGKLRQSIRATYQVLDSQVSLTYVLDEGQSAVRMDLQVDWHEIGAESVPVLRYAVPLAYSAEGYQYDIPAGVIRRPDTANDVPALQYGMALCEEEATCAILVSDCKYGYRGHDNTLALTLINTATSPDPYPERGIQTISLWFGYSVSAPAAAENLAQALTHPLLYYPANAHEGALPAEASLLQFQSDGAVLSAVEHTEKNTLLVRCYEASGKESIVHIRAANGVKAAQLVSLNGQIQKQTPEIRQDTVTFTVPANQLSEIQLTLA